MKKFIWNASLVAIGVFVLFTCGCARSPMRARLDRNFVYNCSLELIEKGVNAVEAERVCASSHRAELLEAERQRKAPASPARMPAAAASVPEKTESSAPDASKSSTGWETDPGVSSNAQPASSEP